MTSTPSLPHTRLRLPIIGDLLTVNFGAPAQGIATQIRKLGAPIMEQRIFNVPVVVIADTALINDVNDEATWEKNVGFTLRKLRPLVGDGLFTAFNEEPNWQRAHNILLPAFTKAAMMSYHDTMTATVREQMDAWRTEAGWIDIPAASNRLTIEIIARAGFGYSFGNLSAHEGSAFLEAVQRELKYAVRNTDAIPFYEKVFGQKRKALHYADKRYIRDWVADIIAARRDQSSADQLSVLDRMLRTSDPDSGEQLDDDNIINQMLTLLVAGSETTANTIAFALHHLSSNPAAMALARAEVDSFYPERDYPTIAFDDVNKLRYLRRVLDETLRLTPVAPGYYRQAKTDTSIGGGRYRFRAGDWVFVALNVAQRDSAWGADAEEFNPDRFLPENLRELGPRIYKPFGTGPRACIGRPFALNEALIALAATLHEFDVEADPNYVLKIDETLTFKPAGLKLRLSPRR